MKNRRALIINRFSGFDSHSLAVQQATEAYQLVQSLGDIEIVDMIHHYGKPHHDTFVGPGQAENIGVRIEKENIDVVILNNTVKPKQLFNLVMLWNQKNKIVEVWDRIDLILQIFSKHAHTMEANLQIRLAQVRHMGPAMYGVGKILSQQRGGIGVRGIGETNLELMKRHWKEEMWRVKAQLSKIQQIRETQLLARREKGLKTVSLVGYTNAGKTTLFNRLTGKDKFVKNYLFATLDSAVGSLYIPKSTLKVIVTDTIGFIEDLPPGVIDAFRSTLMETIHADLILHVVDQSDPYIYEKIDTVEKILSELGIQRKKKIVVFNKTDIAKRGMKQRLTSAYQDFRPVFISAQNGTNIDLLIRSIRRLLKLKELK